MTLQNLSGFTVFPQWGGGIPTNGLAFNNGLTLDAAGEKCAFIFQVPKTGTIDQIGIRFGAVTTAQDIKVSLQDVSVTDGNPDGTPDQYRVIPSASVVANTFVETGLVTSDGTDNGTKRSVTLGDVLSIVVEFDSTDGNLVVSSLSPASMVTRPQNKLYTTSWGVQNNHPLFSLKYSDGAYPEIPVGGPVSATTTLGNGTGGTPDEFGNLITLPVKCRVSGWWGSAIWSGGRDTDIIIYDIDNTAIATNSVDGNQMRQSNTGIAYGLFPTPVTLEANTNYRLIWKPTTVSGNSLQHFTVPSADMMGAFSLGSSCIRTERTDAGSWSETTTQRFLFGLLIDQLDDGVGGSGGNIYNVME